MVQTTMGWRFGREWRLQVGSLNCARTQNTRCGMSKSLFLLKKKISKEVYLKCIQNCNTLFGLFM